VILLRRLGDISNEVGGHLEKNSELLVVDTLLYGNSVGRATFL
jgi:hypothetical protein